MSGVVVGTDGSEGARRALRWAVDEARLRNTWLTVLAVVGVPVTIARASAPFQAGAPLVGRPDPADLRAAEDSVGKELDEVGADDIDTEVRVVAGVPAEELLKAGEGADLVVVGSRGVGGFSRLLLGSVSSQVVQHATCPIVVIPKDRG